MNIQNHKLKTIPWKKRGKETNYKQNFTKHNIRN